MTLYGDKVGLVDGFVLCDRVQGLPPGQCLCFKGLKVLSLDQFGNKNIKVLDVAFITSNCHLTQSDLDMFDPFHDRELWLQRSPTRCFYQCRRLP